MTWAILSGIQGNLTAYEAVLADIKRQGNLVEEIYILGDVVGLTPFLQKGKVNLGVGSFFVVEVNNQRNCYAPI